MIAAIIRIISIRAKAAQNGAVTHHHDQSITPVSLRTINTIPSNPGIPIPVFEFELLIFI